MSDKWKARQRRREEVKRRAAEPSTFFKTCRVLGCKKPARAATQDGLDTRFCASHAAHYARHGSAYRKSYTAAELNPFRRAAVEWLIAHDSDRLVANAVERVRGLYRRAGPHLEAFRLRGLTPRERANAAWARLRKHAVDPLIVIAVWLAVEMKTKNDPQAETRNEFKRVQAAKVVHRLASGSHKRWSVGPSAAIEMHVYPASRGQVLRHLGEDLESAAALVGDQYLTSRARPSAIAHVRPTPRKLRGRRRDGARAQ